MKDTQFITSLLALQCWRDAHEEGLSAMMGCAFVIRNRVRAGWYGGNWLDILANHPKWSATIEPPSAELPDTRNFAFMMLLQQIDGVFNGSLEDNVTMKPDGAASRISLAGPPPVSLYYGRLDRVTNDWFLTNISQNGEQHPRIAQVGLLSFFG